MKRNMLHKSCRRFSACLLALLLCLPSVFGGHAAAASGVLRVESASAQPGEDVQLRLLLDENPGIIALRLLLQYNTAALQLTAVTNGTVFADAGAAFGNDFAAVPFVLLWEDSLSTTNNTAVGTLVTCTFRVLDSAAGNCPVTVSLDTSSIFDVNLLNVPFSVQNGMVTVSTPAACTHLNTAWAISIAATCTQTGTKTQTCADCGSVLTTETILATGHTFGAWQTVAVATATSEGSQLRRCTSCGNTETRAVAMTATLPTKVTVTTTKAANSPTAAVATDAPVEVPGNTAEVTTAAIAAAEGTTSAAPAATTSPGTASVDAALADNGTSPTPMPPTTVYPPEIHRQPQSNRQPQALQNPPEKKTAKPQ